MKNPSFSFSQIMPENVKQGTSYNFSGLLELMSETRFSAGGPAELVGIIDSTIRYMACNLPPRDEMDTDQFQVIAMSLYSLRDAFAAMNTPSGI